MQTLVYFLTSWALNNTTWIWILAVALAVLLLRCSRQNSVTTFLLLHSLQTLHIFHNCGLLKTAGRMLQHTHPIPWIRQVHRIDNERKRESLLAAASISHARVQSGAEVAPALTPTPSDIAAVCFD